jgi:hypothetical protein
VALLVAAPGSSDPLPAYRQSSFTTDPLWESVGNRTRACTHRSFAFGWIPPNRTWPAGAIGGRLDRATDFSAYYARTLPEPGTLDDPLRSEVAFASPACQPRAMSPDAARGPQDSLLKTL